MSAFKAYRRPDGVTARKATPGATKPSDIVITKFADGVVTVSTVSATSARKPGERRTFKSDHAPAPRSAGPKRRYMEESR